MQAEAKDVETTGRSIRYADYDDDDKLALSRGQPPKRHPVDKKAMYQKFLEMPYPEPSVVDKAMMYCHFGITDDPPE